MLNDSLVNSVFLCRI